MVVSLAELLVAWQLVTAAWLQLNAAPHSQCVAQVTPHESRCLTWMPP